MKTKKEEREYLAQCINSLSLTPETKSNLCKQLKWLYMPTIFTRIVYIFSVILVVIGFVSPMLILHTSTNSEQFSRYMLQSTFSIAILGFAGIYSTTRTLERVRFARSVAEILRIKKECEHAPPAGRGEAPRP